MIYPVREWDKELTAAAGAIVFFDNRQVGDAEAVRQKESFSVLFLIPAL